MRRNKQEHRGFYNAIQGSVTNMNLSMWKLISLNEERNFSKKEKCDAEQRRINKQKNREIKTKQNNHQNPNIQNIMNENFGRQVFRFNIQKIISYLHSVSMSPYTFQMYSIILYFARVF